MRAELGHIAPPFALRDQNDENATPLSDEVMGDPAVLIFDRNDPAGDVAESARLLRAVSALHGRMDGLRATIFVISPRPGNDTARLAETESISFGLLSDVDGKVFRAYGLATSPAPADPACVVLDANGRVVLTSEAPDTGAQLERVRGCLGRLAAGRASGPLAMHPPVLVVPNAMDEDLCRRLIDIWHRPVPLWDGDGSVSPGFDLEKGDFKVRNASYGSVVQYVLRDEALAAELDARVMSRVVPQIDKAFGARPTDREDYRIACYDADEQGNLPAHRDNHSRETQHRRFTASVILNGGEYEGGGLAFRESSDQYYEVPPGTAIVWSASLLHEVMPVTSGRRFILGTHLFGEARSSS